MTRRQTATAPPQNPYRREGTRANPPAPRPLYMDCPHKLDTAYLYPSDINVLRLEARTGNLVIRFALPCPDCGDALELAATVDSIEESGPLDDVKESYN